MLPRLRERLVREYDEWTLERMYTTGANDSLSRALADLGLALTIPNVYTVTPLDTGFRFRNAYPDPGRLIRSLLVTWSADTTMPTPERLRAWRARAGERNYDPPQQLLEEDQRFAPIEVNGQAGLELRGIWQDRSDFPAAGPLIARAVTCPAQGRTYYFDAWVYAPEGDKYPYVRQVEILLDSFRCLRATG
jgi:hypothetical protein